MAAGKLLENLATDVPGGARPRSGQSSFGGKSKSSFLAYKKIVDIFAR